jgi:hypothetical protein
MVSLSEALGANIEPGYPGEHGSTALLLEGWTILLCRTFWTDVGVSRRVRKVASLSAQALAEGEFRTFLRRYTLAGASRPDDRSRSRVTLRTIDTYAMTRGKVKIRSKRQGAHIMSAQESAWLTWYMCAVSLMMTALGLLFLIASQSRASAPVFDY